MDLRFPHPPRPSKSILEAIGNTPLVPIKRLKPNRRVEIFAKMESFNPGGSVKDRIALSMIEGAEQRGGLSRDKIILEASSGNTGIGIALVSAVKGYRCLIAMSESASMERRQIMRAYGAEIMLTPARLSTDGAIEAVYRLVREDSERYFCTDQFNNPDNWRAHYEGTALEIWEQTGGRVTTVVATMGTTGTLMGLTRRFRELDPKVRMIGMEPYLGHRIQGLKNMKESYRPGIFDKHLPDAIRNVHDDPAFEMTRRLAREEGLFVGMSSGAAMVAALEEAADMEEGVIVVIFPDGGERYLSTDLFVVPDDIRPDLTSALRLTNTFTHRKEVFEPLSANRVGIYSCGPTAYELAHLGLCRRVVVADLLKRQLEAQGYAVTHVMNITDVDDKTIRAALAQGESLEALTGRYTAAFLEDVATLRVRPASVYPRATAHVDDMVALATRLIERGYAYVKHGSVYFDISKLPSYGRLSRVDLSHIHVGRTVDLDDYEKDSPVDFTLFKRVTLDELKRGMGYRTSWGQVRPGWHIECVAMSTKYLGDFFDIHTSGCDLIFPHHENEIAMAMALTGQPLARTWLHSELVLAEGKKMSRSSGNVVTLRDLLSLGFSGREVRFFLLRTHYRKPLSYSRLHLEEAVRALRRLDQFTAELQRIEAGRCIEGTGAENTEVSKINEDMENVFNRAMNDDLNVSKAMAAIYGLARRVNPLMGANRLSAADARAVLDALIRCDEVLGFLAVPKDRPRLLDEMKAMLAEREAARAAHDWQHADALRQELLKLGVEVMDAPSGQRWRWSLPPCPRPDDANGSQGQ